jgi:hypothetical protein
MDSVFPNDRSNLFKEPSHDTAKSKHDRRDAVTQSQRRNAESLPITCAHVCSVHTIQKLSTLALILRHLWGRLATCGRLVIGPSLWSGRPLRPEFPAQETLPPGPSSARMNATCLAPPERSLPNRLSTPLMTCNPAPAGLGYNPAHTKILRIRCRGFRSLVSVKRTLALKRYAPAIRSRPGHMLDR